MWFTNVLYDYTSFLRFRQGIIMLLKHCNYTLFCCKNLQNLLYLHSLFTVVSWRNFAVLSLANYSQLRQTSVCSKQHAPLFRLVPESYRSLRKTGAYCLLLFSQCSVLALTTYLSLQDLVSVQDCQAFPVSQLREYTVTLQLPRFR